MQLSNNIYLQLVMQKLLGVSEAEARSLLAKWAPLQLKAARGKMHEVARKMGHELYISKSARGSIYHEDTEGLDAAEYRSALIERTPTKCFSMKNPITDGQMQVRTQSLCTQLIILADYLAPHPSGFTPEWPPPSVDNGDVRTLC